MKFFYMVFVNHYGEKILQRLRMASFWMGQNGSDRECCGASSLTEMKDGKCQVIIDATTALQTTFEYCRQNNYIANPSGNHSETVRKVCSPVVAGSAQHLNLLDKCTDGFLTDDCRSQLESIL